LREHDRGQEKQGDDEASETTYQAIGEESTEGRNRGKKTRRILVEGAD